MAKPKNYRLQMATDMRNEILLQLAPRHDPKLVDKTSREIIAHIQEKYKDLPSGTVALAMGLASDSCIAAMID